jgi:hypothetical protein
MNAAAIADGGLQLLLVSALRVRRTVRRLSMTVSCLAVAIAHVRMKPGLAAYLRLLRGAVAGTPAGGDQTNRSPRTLRERSTSGNRPEQRLVLLHNPAGSPPVILKDPRVRRLQERAVRVLFDREFAVTIDRNAATTLGAYSSVLWLRHNLLTAAGCASARAVSWNEVRNRCRVVFPVFIRTMTMHRRFLECGVLPLRSGVGRRRSRLYRRLYRRRYRVGEYGEILGSFYPRAIPEAQRRLQRYQRRERTRREYRRERTAYPLLRFDRYLEAITLISMADVTVPARATRTLDALHRVCQGKTRGGTLWRHGPMDRRTRT